MIVRKKMPITNDFERNIWISRIHVNHYSKILLWKRIPEIRIFYLGGHDPQNVKLVESQVVTLNAASIAFMFRRCETQEYLKKKYLWRLTDKQLSIFRGYVIGIFWSRVDEQLQNIKFPANSTETFFRLFWCGVLYILNIFKSVKLGPDHIWPLISVQ